jgi:beta-barrel assembly-enhancing protease
MRAGKWIIALLVALFSLGSYWGTRSFNPVTKENQHVAMSPDQEVALGLEAAPQLARQHGGLSSNRAGAAQVQQVGERLVEQTAARETPYRFQFHLLDDDKTLNAFALPGGQVFITDALFDRLKTEGELAGVLGHEVGHVVARHGAEHLAKQQLIQGLGGAAVIAAYDPNDPRGSQRNQMVAAAVASLVNMKFGRNDELESDRLGVRFMGQSGYDPRAMVRVMEVLSEASRRGRTPEFFSTHPNPENRISRIKQAIETEFPQGLPSQLRG